MAAALQLYPIINNISLKPNPTTYITLLDKCSVIEEAKQIHAQMLKAGTVHETISASKLLTALCKTSNATSNGSTYPLQFFNTIQEPNTFMWNTIIKAFSNSQNSERSILLYSQMLYNASPHNLYTFPFLLKVCNLKEIHQVHCHAIKLDMASELHTANSLVHAYAKSSCTQSARLIFESIQCRDAVSWNSMVNGYIRNGQIQAARGLFDQMNGKNVVSWTSMINGYVKSGLFQEALELFQDMQESGVEPDKVTLTCVLSACAQLGALEQGQWINTYIERKRIQLDKVLGCALVDMYAKCGDLDKAVDIFKIIKHRKCVHLWTAMINGFAVHGQGQEALRLFEEMEEKGIEPNEITFTAVLTACNYSGLLEEGNFMFNRIEKEIGPSIEHYGCMVDILGRAGLLEKAEEMITEMTMKPNAAVWGALLTACRVHRDYNRGVRVGNILIELEPGHSGRYISLANMFAAKGEWKQGAIMRGKMKQREVLKLPGSSLIAFNGKVHEFIAGDRSHPEMEKIYDEWSKILGRLKEECYAPDTEELLLDLEEEEKETAIHWHSEKLAIAFGIIKTEPGATIQIIKNLKICQDCHNVAKIISKVYSRKIVMRDRKRYHIFEDGLCSCKDYW